jgi:hypothetical protein
MFFSFLVHRIYLHCIANEDSLLSYCLLARWAVLYSSVLNFEEKDMTLKDLTVEITYVDDEMDIICFSSNEELVDALLQFSKLKHTSNSSIVLCCKAVMQSRKQKGKNSKKSNDSRTNGQYNSSYSSQASHDRSHACPKLSTQCSTPPNLVLNLAEFTGMIADCVDILILK